MLYCLPLQDRVIYHRLENVTHCVEKGEWPVQTQYYIPPPGLSDSRSNTPLSSLQAMERRPAPGIPKASSSMAALQELSLFGAATPEGPVSRPSPLPAYRSYLGVTEEDAGSDDSRGFVRGSLAQVGLHAVFLEKQR